jgi:Tol biopolymer transport system component
VYALKPTGESALRLTTSAAVDAEPVYSPKGQRLSFTRAMSGGVVELWRMNADGSTKVRLLARVPGLCPQLSPDGRFVAVTRNSQIWVVNVNGTGLRQLTHPFRNATEERPYTESDRCPVWSPDGKRLAHVRSAPNDDTSSSMLRVITLDGRSDKAVAGAGDINAVDWRPDGTQLVFSTATRCGFGCGGLPPNGSVETVWANGTGRVVLMSNFGAQLGVAWSPDSQRIAFGHVYGPAQEGPSDSPPTALYTMRASDGADLRLKRAGVAPISLSWQAN